MESKAQQLFSGLFGNGAWVLIVIILILLLSFWDN